MNGPRSVAWRGMQHGLKLLEKRLKIDNMAQEEQHLSWGPSANGRFTTKLAYALLMEDTH